MVVLGARREKRRGMEMGISFDVGGSFTDTFGVPEFFTTHVHLENAGSGLIRSIRSVERCGLLIPVFSYVTPAVSMVENGPRHREFAEGVLRATMLMLGSH